MSISFDAALGIHPKALQVFSRRAELLASNLANVSTPGYKARDIDFRAAIQAAMQARQQQSGVQADTLSADTAPRADRLRLTHPRHMAMPMQDRVSFSSEALEAQYRIPDQPSLDGNTVDAQHEKAAFAENALRYQASLGFLDSKFKGLKAAIRGE